MMNNFSIKDDKGKEHWISRSVSVVMFVFCKNLRGEWCVLASQRGEGTPDPELINAWNCQCGYLDYNETTKEAAQRETLEETGIKVPSHLIKFWTFNDNPNDDKRQNITFRYYAVYQHAIIDDFKFSRQNMDKNEVGAIAWINLKNIDKMRWAFNHDKLIKGAAVKAGIIPFKMKLRLFMENFKLGFHTRLIEIRQEFHQKDNFVY